MKIIITEEMRFRQRVVEYAKILNFKTPNEMVEHYFSENAA